MTAPGAHAASLTEAGSQRAAVWLWVRRDARRRVRSLAVLAVLVAVAAGVVLAVTAGARRDGTAVERAASVTAPGDVYALPNEPGFDWDAVRRFPEVAAVGEFAITLVTVDGLSPDGSLVGFPPVSPELGVDVERPVVVRGRAIDRSRVDEAVVGTDVPGVRVGDHLTVRMYAPAAIESAMTGGAIPERPDGPAQDVTVVGVVKDAFTGAGVQLSQAFVERYRESILPPHAYVNAAVRLRGGAADIPTFQQHVDALAGHPVELQDQYKARKSSTHATDLERTALYGFAIAAAVASVVLVGRRSSGRWRRRRPRCRCCARWGRPADVLRRRAGRRPARRLPGRGGGRRWRSPSASPGGSRSASVGSSNPPPVASSTASSSASAWPRSRWRP